MSRFRILQKTVSKSKHYLIDLQYIKCIFAQYLSKFFETYFERKHPMQAVLKSLLQSPKFADKKYLCFVWTKITSSISILKA